MSTSGFQNPTPASKIRPQAWKNKRCAPKNHAEPRPRKIKRSHIAQVMAKNHFGGASQNPSVCKGRLERKKLIFHWKKTRKSAKVPFNSLKTDGFLKVRSILYCKNQWILAPGSVGASAVGWWAPLTNTARTPTDKSVWGNRKEVTTTCS